MNPFSPNHGKFQVARPLAVAALSALVFSACKREKPAAEAVPVPLERSAPTQDTVVASVRGGETLDAIFRNLDLAEDEFRSLIAGVRTHFRFPIHAGEQYRAVFARAPGEFRLGSFALAPRSGDCLHLLERDSAADGGGALFRYVERELEVRIDTAAVRGALSGNLFDSFRSLGETPALIDEVARIFAWDIDFFRDPRAGDSFQVLVEKKFAEGGNFIGYGRVLAARYVNAGHAFDAVLYGDRYYAADGRSLEKRLMKAPLRFSRISSGFTRSRLHPVLGVRRPHWGVDYAAPMGTPIFAAGDGMVVYAHWSSGYGRTIKIRHNGVYSTYYGHLQGYARGIAAGKRVTQGQTIGYLGQSGLATGPHLDYRVERGGRFVNPVSIVSEPMEGVPAAERAVFHTRRDGLFARLEGGPPATRVAHQVPADSVGRGG